MGDSSSLETIRSSSTSNVNPTTLVDLHILPQLKFLIENITNIVQTQSSTETHQISRSQILKLFNTNGFAGFVTGEAQCPIKCIVTDESISIENPHYSVDSHGSESCVGSICNNISIHSSLYLKLEYMCWNLRDSGKTIAVHQ